MIYLHNPEQHLQISKCDRVYKLRSLKDEIKAVYLIFIQLVCFLFIMATALRHFSTFAAGVDLLIDRYALQHFSAEMLINRHSHGSKNQQNYEQYATDFFH